ncbi:hypothetical protein FNV43_RR19558 [Rhamnella rubrinervis]|uniref:TF-B3 domain-containing protein n=1 Tax=Rhamnella rubrinervis TaxID=2594499 RepID=A0A8K0DT73_9ROSA|nr:hypothetical protein FNV43_RR19558 [Rhamnella rubrinervis]
MRHRKGACAECTRKCLHIHGKNDDSSPAVNSFFKVMIGQKFSEVLFLPPKFARLLPDMVNQKAILEDSSGFRWDVTISNVDGSSAFLQGWDDFSLAHNVKVGDFLVFDYIMKSHFFVKIYDKTGCEKKLNSSERHNQRKRRRDDKKIVIDGSCHTIDTSLSNEQGSSSSHLSGLNGKKSKGLNKVNDVEEEPIATQNINERCEFVSKAENIDEMYLMMNRDLEAQQGEDRGPIIDLFSFEMWNNSGGGGINRVSGTDESFPQYVDSSMVSQNEVLMIDNKPMAKEVDEEVFMISKFSIAVPSDGSNQEMIEMDNSSKEMDRKFISDNNPSIDKTSVNLLPIFENPEENGESVPDMLNREFSNCQLAEGSGKASSTSEPLSANAQDELSQKAGCVINYTCQSAEKKCTRTSESFDAPASVGTQNCLSDQIMKAAKKELVDNISDPCSQ